MDEQYGSYFDVKFSLFFFIKIIPILKSIIKNMINFYQLILQKFLKFELLWHEILTNLLKSGLYKRADNERADKKKGRQEKGPSGKRADK